MEGITPFILSYEELFSMKAMEGFGRKAAVTDACIIRGCDFSSYSLSPNYTDSLTGRVGPYVLRGYKGKDEVEVIGGYGAEFSEHIYNSGYCIRLALRLSDELFERVVANSYKGYNDLRYVDLGFYPQNAPEWEIQRKYMKDSEYVRKVNHARRYNLGTCYYDEIEYLGRRYIVVPANFSSRKYEKQTYFYKAPNYVPTFTKKASEVLSNGHTYKQGELCMLEILPVTWIIDYETKTLISKTNLVSGISYFEPYQSKSSSFEESKIGSFVYDCMLPDILQGVDFIAIKNNNKPIEVSIAKSPVPYEFTEKEKPIVNEYLLERKTERPQAPVANNLGQPIAIHEIVKHNKLSNIMNGVVSSTAKNNEVRLRNIKTQIFILPYESKRDIKLINYFINRLNELIDRYNDEYETLNNSNLTEFSDTSFEDYLRLLENDVSNAVKQFYSAIENSENGFRI